MFKPVYQPSTVITSHHRRRHQLIITAVAVDRRSFVVFVADGCDMAVGVAVVVRVTLLLLLSTVMPSLL